MSGYDEENDGGIREAEENRFWPGRDAELLEEYRRWRAIFESGLTTTNAKNQDNETTNTPEVQ